MSESRISVLQADLSRPDHQEAMLGLLDGYSQDPMGDGHPLSETARREVIPGLRAHPTTVVFLAFSDSAPVGVAICFRGFSTFAARPLINIHDFFVRPDWRGRGISRRLLEAVEQYARAEGCCKLTLEVLENNHRAKGVYAAAGFAQLQYLPEAGGAIYLAKPLQ